MPRPTRRRQFVIRIESGAGALASQPGLGGRAAGLARVAAGSRAPGLETVLEPLTPQQTEAAFTGVVDDLRWMDPSRRGF